MIWIMYKQVIMTTTVIARMIFMVNTTNMHRNTANTQRDTVNTDTNTDGIVMMAVMVWMSVITITTAATTNTPNLCSTGLYSHITIITV